MEETFPEYLYHLCIRLKAKIFTYFLALSLHSVGKKTSICPPLRFYNLKGIQIGNGVTIHRDCWIIALEHGDFREYPKLIIEDNTSIGMGATISAVKRIIIEKHVFTARNVYISDHGHAFQNINIPTSIQGIQKIGDVRIGAETWLGQNSIVLPGVTIGRHCIIGANSVVNCDIPDYSVAVGAPAKVIKTYNPGKNIWEYVSKNE